jgi:hypothetical protein
MLMLSKIAARMTAIDPQGSIIRKDVNYRKQGVKD